MKIQKSLLALVFFLAFAALGASAAPLPEAASADTQPAVEAQPTDVFGASVLSQSADCARGDAAKSVTLDPWICGACSQAACRLLGVGDVCGSGAGGIKYCRDWSGALCTDGGSRCHCTNAIEP